MEFRNGNEGDAADNEMGEKSSGQCFPMLAKELKKIRERIIQRRRGR